MSDLQIFLIGLFASLLMLMHLVIHIVQFRKLSKEPGERDKKRRLG